MGFWLGGAIFCWKCPWCPHWLFGPGQASKCENQKDLALTKLRSHWWVLAIWKYIMKYFFCQNPSELMVAILKKVDGKIKIWKKTFDCLQKSVFLLADCKIWDYRNKSLNYANIGAILHKSPWMHQVRKVKLWTLNITFLSNNSINFTIEMPIIAQSNAISQPRTMVIEIEHTIVADGTMSGEIRDFSDFTSFYDERGGRKMQQVKQYLSLIGWPRMLITRVLGCAHSSRWKKGSEKRFYNIIEQ